MKIYFLVLVLAVLVVSGCAGLKIEKSKVNASPEKSPAITETSELPALKSPEVTQEPSPVKVEPSRSPTPAQEPLIESYDNPPLISSSSLNPSNPSLGDPSILSITATDDKGLEKISWTSDLPFSAGTTDSYKCNSQTSCSFSWDLLAKEQGLHKVVVSVIDTSGKEAKQTFDLNVGPARPKYSPTPSPTTTGTATSSPTTTGSSSVSCSSNSACGYKKACIGGVCQDVDCTSDSHCSGCRRCSSNRCVSCGSGPYGCYC